MVLFEHGAEFFRDSLGTDHGSAAANTYEVHMRNGGELRNHPLKEVFVNGKGVSPGEKHIPERGGVADVVDALGDLLLAVGLVGFPGVTPSGAVTAIHGALIRHEKKSPVGIAVGESRDGGIHVLMKWIVDVCPRDVGLHHGGDRLHAHGAGRVVRIHEGRVVGSNSHAKLVEALFDLCRFFIGDIDNFSKGGYIGYTIGDLPLPIVPLFLGYIFPQADMTIFGHLSSPHNKILRRSVNPRSPRAFFMTLSLLNHNEYIGEKFHCQIFAEEIFHFFEECGTMTKNRELWNNEDSHLQKRLLVKIVFSADFWG